VIRNRCKKGLSHSTTVSLLPIGNTHADIHQTFSCTSRRLKTNVAIRMYNVLRQLSKSFTPAPHVSKMRRIANLSGLCKQEGCTGNFEAFSYFRYFWFHSKNGAPSTEGASFLIACYVRLSCKDNWKPLETFAAVHGFIFFTPILSNMPLTVTNCPNDLKEVRQNPF